MSRASPEASPEGQQARCAAAAMALHAAGRAPVDAVGCLHARAAQSVWLACGAPWAKAPPALLEHASPGHARGLWGGRRPTVHCPRDNRVDACGLGRLHV
jgi:hypothetical protein